MYFGMFFSMRAVCGEHGDWRVSREQRHGGDYVTTPQGNHQTSESHRQHKVQGDGSAGGEIKGTGLIKDPRGRGGEVVSHTS